MLLFNRCAMKLKKIYIEITNRCNLSCRFCIHNQRPFKDMTLNEYKVIIDKIKGKTREVYLHVLGEPLLHNDINEFIDYASLNGLKVNITTNGYLINKIIDNENIYRLNISMHSYDSKNGVEIDEYLNNLFNVIDKLRDKTFVSLRLWVGNKATDYMLKCINKRYNSNVGEIYDDMKERISDNLIIDTNHEFIWPDLENKYYSCIGTCRGLIDHIGILVDGTIIPCCLDSKGIINLGNIFYDEIEDVYNKEIVKEMILGFKNNQKVHDLCKHCYFLKKAEDKKVSNNSTKE